MPKRLLTDDQERSIMAEIELRRRLTDKAIAARHGLDEKQLKDAVNYLRNRSARLDSAQSAE